MNRTNETTTEDETGGAGTQRWGLTDDELAAKETVFRGDLLEGHRVVISGGGSGIGRAMAFLFTRLGAQVMICGRSAERLEGARRAIAERLERDVLTHAMTIRDERKVEALLDHAFEAMGGLDTLVNNGGGQFAQDAIDFTKKGWRAVIDTNLNGTWYMMQGAAQRWRARGEGGNIVNIVADVSRGMPQAAHTCAARAGVIYLSKTVSTEWAPLKIRVNCIAPGTIATEGFSVYPPEAVKRFDQANPMRKLGDAWDIAEGAVYLAAPSGKFITGEVLTIDGGMQQWGVVWPAGIPDYFKVDGSA